MQNDALVILHVHHARVFFDTNTFFKNKNETKTFFKTKDMHAHVEKMEYIRSFMAHLNLTIPGVMIEQGILGKNGAARSITPGNEVG